MSNEGISPHTPAAAGASAKRRLLIVALALVLFNLALALLFLFRGSGSRLAAPSTNAAPSLADETAPVQSQRLR